MEKKIKPLVYPDRVLSLVVLLLSLFMILGSSYLSYAQVKMEDFSMVVKRDSDVRVEALISARQQQVLGAEDEAQEGDEVSGLSDEETE